MILSCFAFQSEAQSLISGVVKDSASFETIPGVTIRVQGMNLGGIADVDGKFSLNNLPDKDITLVFDHIGYKAKTLVFKKNAKRENVTVYLSLDSKGLNEVMVKGIAEGQIRALVDMKNADNIKNIISSKQILSFPDVNAAEVLQRIPGITLQRDQGEGRYIQLRGTPPQLTNFNINGEQVPSPEGNFRYIGMDIIPSDQIKAVEVTKVLTPDMDGDAIGGSINVKTTDPPKGAPQSTFTFASGYNHLRSAPIYNAQFSYGFTHKKVGFQINGSYFENNQASENIEYKFIKGPFFNTGSQGDSVDNYQVHYRESQLRHYEITRKRISVSPTLIYTHNDRNKFYLKGMYNRFSDDEIRRRMIYDLEDPLNARYFLYGSVNHDVKDRTKLQDLSTLSLGAEHEWKQWTVDYQLFYSVASENEPDRLEAVFESPGQAISIRFEDMDTDYPKASYPNEDNAYLVTDWANYELDPMMLEESFIREQLITPRFNVRYDFKWNNPENKGYLKFGAKVRSRTKERDTRNQTFGAFRTTSLLYPGEAPPLNLVTAVDGFYTENLLGQNYTLQHMPSATALRDFYEYWPQFFIFDRNESRKNSYNGDYQYAEDIYAAYTMLRQEFRRFMVLAGLRFERTDVTRNTGYGVILNGNRFVGMDTIDVQRIQDFWLPQVQMKYRLNTKINLRAAITYTYSRPNYSDIIPYRWEDRREVSIGNPNLNYPRATNYDLMIERYHKSSIFSAGAFYKKITDFVVNYTRFGREGAPGSGNFPVFEFTKPINGQDAYVFGLEGQAQFKWTKLPGFLKYFGLFANYTYTRSAAYIPRRVPANYSSAVILNVIEDDLSVFFEKDGREQISLPGQAEHNANLSLFFDKDPWFLRLSANYQDEYLLELGPDPDLDVYYDRAFRLDFTGSVKLSKNLNIFTNWVNLTNAPLRYYLGEKSRVQKLEFYSFWGTLGLRLQW